MTAAFTPGPWGYEQFNGDWLITYDLAAEHGPRGLGKVFDYASEFEEANARLIAAAPELYEALEMIGAEVFPHPNSAHVYIDTIRAVANRALAKARGEPA